MWKYKVERFKNNLSIGIICFIILASRIIVFVAQEHSFRQSMTEETEGVVTQVIGGVHITHSVNGEQYTSRLSNFFAERSNRREGERVRIFYDPNNPARIRTDNNTLSMLLTSAFVFALLILLLFIAKLEADMKNVGKTMRESTRVLYSKPLKIEPLPSSSEDQSLFSDDEPDLKKIESELIANFNELDENDRYENNRYKNSEENFFMYEMLLYVAVGVFSFGYWTW